MTTAFNQLGLSDKALAAVKRMGFEQPTPVQEQAIPLVLEGRDLIAGAQTGTGKTAAFSLPALDKLAHAKGGSGPLMLVITPTRELAQQIGEVAEQIALSTHHRITTVVGGLSYKPQIDRLKRGTDILIATPGRLIDLMNQSAVRLDDVEVLVLDEADRMLDMGFLPSVKKIVAATPATRQTLLFSATIDDSILDVVGTMLHDPATVEIARKGSVAETVEQYVIHVPQSVKPALIKAVLAEKGGYRVIVFARTRSRADSTCKRLRKAGYTVEAIHSDRSQNQRKRALDKFASGEVQIITATDVLARGIDVDMVDYVINYDIPEQAEDYIHRIGRTGRAGQSGFSVTFVTPDNKKELHEIEKLIKCKIPELTLENFDMAEAEATAAATAITARSKRDPEVNRVKRELANKAQKRQEEAAALEEARAERKRAKSSGKKASAAPSSGKQQRRPPASGKAAKTASQTRRKTAAPEQPKRQAKNARPAKGKATGAAQQNPKSTRQAKDFRPGRAHRAELKLARKRPQR